MLLTLSITSLFILAICERIAFGAWPELTGITPYTDPSQEFHRGKTLWDLLELLIIPAMLAGGAFWLNRSARRVELEIERKRSETARLIEEERDCEAALQAYLDKMSELMLDRGLAQSKPGDAVRDVARSRTLTALRVLDGARKGLILRFLYEADLINRNAPIIDMRGADLSGADLYLANLYNANLREVAFNGADLREALLEGAELAKSSFDKADLRGASLRWANLREASMRRADLRGAALISADLDLANLSGSNLNGAFLNRANFSDATLINANLSKTDMSETSLFGANLSGTRLRGAKLGTANLYWTDLSKADLQGVAIIDEQLTQARSLEGATMPNGTVHD